MDQDYLNNMSRHPATSARDTTSPGGTAAPANVLDERQAQALQSIPGMTHRTLLGELTDMMRQAMPDRLAELNHYASVQDGKMLALQAHALAGSCASIGGRQMQATVLAIEHAAETNDWSRMTSLLSEVAQAWTLLDEALAAYTGC